MAVGDSSNKPARDLPALVPGEIMADPDQKQPGVDATAKKLYQDVQSANVQMFSANGYRLGAGSGFFEKSTHDAITNAHVVVGKEEFFVKTPDGKMHQAKIVDMDDIKDVARLNVPDLTNLKGTDLPSLSLSDHSPVSGDKVYAFGHPLGSESLYVSPGSVYGRGTYGDFLSGMAEKNGHPLSVEKIKALSLIGHSPTETPEILARLDKEMTFTDAHIERGNSGGPFTDAHGKVVGLASIDGNDITGMVTATDVQSFLNEKQPKFRFDYENQSTAHVWMRHWQTDPWQNVRAAGSDAVLGALGLRTMSSGKFLRSGALLGAVAANDMVANYEHFTTNTSGMRKLEAGMGMVADSVGLLGAAALMVPKVRHYSEIALKAGAAVWTASKFLPSHLILTKTTRVEGQDRPPTPFDD